ncbi:MAG TPA: hypothetical protein GXZ28_08775 [Clostridiales bacterium]|jgi:Zn finger protein HypA/HybF involved in hydrogenase expression|nr:hypothetical protein [Clostridiales bacterium]
MKNNNKYICPVCKSKDLTLRYEASYVYSYIIDSDAPGLKNRDAFQSYKYDKRELKSDRDYIECNHCRSQFPSSLAKVLRSENDHAEYII